MSKTYEYCTYYDDQDVVITLEIVSFTSQKALGPEADNDADCYGYTSIEWHTEDDVSFMTDDDVQRMEEWLSIEHEEYLWDQAYYD